MPDGKRRRRHSKNQSRRRYYAKHRAIRFANRFWNPCDITKVEMATAILAKYVVRMQNPSDQSNDKKAT
ncbi:MAG: hypothetical protein KGQ60_02425 [Planctomycetes bacterium]|nr:hypothetical protein [Planctomycetota bacterium]